MCYKLKNMKILILLILSFHLCNTYEILISTPYIIRSLHSLFAIIATNLANNGHTITYISNHDNPNPHPNITMILTPQTTQLDNLATNMFTLASLATMKDVIAETHRRMIPLVWDDIQVQKAWKNRNKFDAIICMSYFNEVGFPFLMDSKAHLIQVSTPGVEPISLIREGNWLSPAVTPSVLMNTDQHMDFIERAFNLPSLIVYYILTRLSHSYQTTAFKEYFPDIGDIQSYYDRVALTLINGNFGLDGPVPLLPSQIEIGTLNIKNQEPLPKDIEEFMNGSGDDGVIYFSIGSIAKSIHIPAKAKEMFIQAFRQLSSRILWKTDGEELDLPPNVMTKSWMPQQDILRHNKTRVFISHCGNLGTQEAKYYGVPVLGVPIAVDQPRNAIRMEKRGFAIVLKWDDITVDKILTAIRTLIDDKSYKKRLDDVSRILQDQKERPAERAVWWVEYVLRHNGAPHLRYAARDLSLFQYLMLDVLAFWFAIMAASVFVLVTFLRWLISKFVAKNDKPFKAKQRTLKKKKQ